MRLRASSVVALLASCWLATAPSAQAPGPNAPPTPLLPAISDAEFSRLITDLSERGGSFRMDNYVSNETMLSETLEILERQPRAVGAYIGVGPEQNFSYIVVLRPAIAFILDIRRDNLLQHLLYKAVAELSADRREFLTRLFSRHPPLGPPMDDELPVLLAALRKIKPSEELYRRNVAEVIDLLTVRRGLVLTNQDRRRLTAIYERFKKDGPEITYAGKTPQWPTFAEIVTDTDGGGVSRTFLSTEARFQIFKTYEERNLIVPIVGNFAGRTALRAIGDDLRARNLAVKVFYLSNVEQYLFGGGAFGTGSWEEFYRNVETLPRHPDSVFIRSIPALGAPFPMGNTPRYRPTVSGPPEVINSIGAIETTLGAFRDRSLDSYSAIREIGGALYPGSEADVVRLFASYATGAPVSLTPSDPVSFSSTFKRAAGTWIESASVTERQARERAVALAVLETARNATEGEESQWRDYKPLIEWVCDRLRHGEPSEFERSWMLAAVALGARAGDAYFIADHRGSCKNKQPCNQARHGLGRFPADKGFELAALLSYPALRVASNRPGVSLDVLMGKPVGSIDDRREAYESLDKLLTELDRLGTDPGAGDEARLRAGVLRYHLHSLPPALVDFRAVAANASDRELVYLARLFSGLSYSALRKPHDAVREFRAALETIPGARAAATALAAQLVQTEAHEEALALVDAAFVTSGVDDPWYRFADLHWPAAIARMREELRK